MNLVLWFAKTHFFVDTICFTGEKGICVCFVKNPWTSGIAGWTTWGHEKPCQQKHGDGGQNITHDVKQRGNCATLLAISMWSGFFCITFNGIMKVWCSTTGIRKGSGEGAKGTADEGSKEEGYADKERSEERQSERIASQESWWAEWQRHWE